MLTSLSLNARMQFLCLKNRAKVLTITPEGTRKANPEWKKGFYYIARGAKVPVLLMAFDFPTRTVNITKELLPSDDVEADIMVMKQHFKSFKGKHPEKFAI